MNDMKTYTEHLACIKDKYKHIKNYNLFLNMNHIASDTFKEVKLKNDIIQYYCEFIKCNEKVDNDKPYGMDQFD